MSYIYPDRVVNALTLTGATTNINGNNFDTSTGKGLIVIVDITAITAGSLTVTVEGFDEISGKYYTLLASAALAAAATTVLRIYPGLTPSANVTVSDVTPAKCRVRVTTVTGPVTATIAVNVIE